MTCIARDADGVLISIKAQPRASKTEICGLHGGELKVRVAAPPVDDAANDALLRFLADRIGCRRNQLSFEGGARSNHKVIRVTGVEIAVVSEALSRPG